MIMLAIPYCVQITLVVYQSSSYMVSDPKSFVDDLNEAGIVRVRVG